MLNNFSLRFLRVTNTEASRDAEERRWTNSLVDCLQYLFISCSPRRRTFLWVPYWAISLCPEANCSFNSCVPNFSSLISPSLHFIGLTHWRNSAKCLNLLIIPFTASQDSYGLIFLHIAFSVIQMKFGEEGKLNSYVSPVILNLKSVLWFCLQLWLTIQMLEIFYSNSHSILPTSTSRRFELRNDNVSILIK